jgi:hypothetical protein
MESFPGTSLEMLKSKMRFAAGKQEQLSPPLSLLRHVPGCRCYFRPSYLTLAACH